MGIPGGDVHLPGFEVSLQTVLARQIAPLQNMKVEDPVLALDIINSSQASLVELL